MNLRQDVEKTIDYAKRYGQQLTVEELKTRLISENKFNCKKIDIFLQKNKDIQSKLKVKNNNLFDKEKILKTLKLEKIVIKNFKDILFLGITGSLAADNSKKNDDIDIMIITKVNTLWVTRLKLRWFVFINKIAHRKYGAKERKDEFCFNLWLDEENLKLPRNKQNLKSAVDLILLKPVIDKDGAYKKFLIVNDWAKKWMATGYDKIVDRRSLIVDEKTKFNCVDWLVNFLVFVPQYLWMLPKIKKEQVNLRQAFFHRN